MLFICTFYCIVCQIVYQIAPVFKEDPHFLPAAQRGALQGACLDTSGLGLSGRLLLGHCQQHLGSWGL